MVSDILPDIVYDIISQAGFLPPLDKEAAGIITDSEASFKEFATKHSLNASTINFFIKGTKLHFKSPMADRRHVLCVGVGGDRTHAGPLRKSRACPP